jgi:polysaccharide deacetylase family protein (PEP-CTERM system associated)
LADTSHEDQSGPQSTDKRFLISIDVEDWYQVENLREWWPHTRWPAAESRVAENVYALLGILDEFGTKATFFTLGCVAKAHPRLVREIFDRGHEIASHGFNHVLTPLMTLEQWEDDVVSAKKLLEDITGAAVRGYRAPSFSIQTNSFEILHRAGYQYDSSFFPVAYHDRYGKLDLGPLAPVMYVQPGIYEVPISFLAVGPLKLPWGGGAYFRIMPFPLFRWGVKRIARNLAQYMFYLHPWEIDPAQPYQKQLRTDRKLRHYTGLKTTARKLRQLLSQFSFRRVDTILAPPAATTPAVATLSQPAK